MSPEETFINLAKEYEKQHDLLDTIREELEQAEQALGINKYVQDPETGAVYKIIKPEGTFIKFHGIGYKRTSMNGERGGTLLSKKEAEEAGFVVGKG